MVFFVYPKIAQIDLCINVNISGIASRVKSSEIKKFWNFTFLILQFFFLKK